MQMAAEMTHHWQSLRSRSRSTSEYHSNRESRPYAMRAVRAGVPAIASCYVLLECCSYNIHLCLELNFCVKLAFCLQGHWAGD
jgi:hypothetical protein